MPTFKEKNSRFSESNEAAAKLEIIKYSKNSQEETDIVSKRASNAVRSISLGTEGAKDVCTMLAKYSRWIVLVIREIFVPIQGGARFAPV